MNVDWTDEMVYDLKKYESEAETFIPGCLSENITSIKVSASCKPEFPKDSYHRHGNHAHREILIAPPMGDLSGRRPGLAISSTRNRFLWRLPQARFFRIKKNWTSRRKIYSDPKFARHVGCCVVGSEIACEQALLEFSGIRPECQSALGELARRLAVT